MFCGVLAVGPLRFDANRGVQGQLLALEADKFCLGAVETALRDAQLLLDFALVELGEAFLQLLDLTDVSRTSGGSDGRDVCPNRAGAV